LAALWTVFLFLSVVTSKRDGSPAIVAQVLSGAFLLMITVVYHINGEESVLVAAGLYAAVLVQVSALIRSEVPFLAGLLGPFAAAIMVVFVRTLCQRARADNGLHAAEFDTPRARWRPRVPARPGDGTDPGAEEAPAEFAGPPSSPVQP
jgi:hypothetical protein